MYLRENKSSFSKYEIRSWKSYFYIGIKKLKYCSQTINPYDTLCSLIMANAK